MSGGTSVVTRTARVNAPETGIRTLDGEETGSNPMTTSRSNERFLEMTSQRGCTIDRVSSGWEQHRMTSSSLLLKSHLQGRCLVVRPVGHLSPETYERLRDGLFACAADEPAAIVVDLACMQTAIASLLTVFPTVARRIDDWPGMPLVLAAARQPLRAMLDTSTVSGFVPVYGAVSEAIQDLDAAPQPRRRQVQLPCQPESSRRARQLVRQTCQEWSIPDIIPDAVVVASELIDNMVQHARSEGQLRLELRRNKLSVAVTDADPRQPQLRLPGLSGAGGRGLVLVNRLSRAWGSAARLGGKVVWAVLNVSPRPRIHNVAARRPSRSSSAR
jgi:anti-sigma regulatory factor (Ser/Thr protein kinase)